jgi:chromosome partitioning protein
MRIRRRDRDIFQVSQPNPPAPEREGPTSTEPVRNVVEEPDPVEHPGSQNDVMGSRTSRADENRSHSATVDDLPPEPWDQESHQVNESAAASPVMQPSVREEPKTPADGPGEASARPAQEPLDPESTAGGGEAHISPTVVESGAQLPEVPNEQVVSPPTPGDQPLEPEADQADTAEAVVPPEPVELEAVAEVPESGPVMRPPTISDDASQLLNGTKPDARELPRIIAIANQKGGVGKTTTTVNLGAALAEMGYRVLVIDLDPQGNATTGLGVEARNFEYSMYDVIMRDQPLEDCIEPTSVKNLFVAPATIDLAGIEIELVPAFSRELKLKRAIDTVVDDFDFVLIDCPPSLGLITVNGLAAADEVLVPIQCEYYALEGLSQLLRNVKLVSSNLNETLEVSTIVLTMFDSRTRLSVDVANEVREHFGERVCHIVIPRTVRLSEAPSFGQPITVFDPASRGAVAYRELAKEVSNGAPQRTR